MKPILSRELTQEVRASFGLAWPLMLGFLGNNLLSIVDTAMVGRLGKNELAGASIGAGIFFTLSIFAAGFIFGLDPIVSQAVGAGEGARVRQTFSASVRLAGWVTLPAVLAIWASPYLLPLFSIDEAIVVETKRFLLGRAPGAAPFIFAMLLRSFLQAQGITKPMMVSTILANVVNLALNYAFIFGSPALGIPAMGTFGSGLASTAAVLVQVGVLWIVHVRSPFLPGVGALDVTVRKLARIGAPIAWTLLAEVGAFTLVGIATGSIGAEAAGGHQVAIQWASATFVVAMGAGSAASVRVGQAVGRADPDGARRAAWVNVGIVLAYMSMTAMGFFFFAEPLAGVLTDQPSVIAVAVPLLHVAAMFQLFDGIQVVTLSALRGLGDTLTAQRANLFGYYVVGLPLGFTLAFVFGLGALGLWIGLTSGLMTVATAGFLKLRQTLRGPLTRVA